MTDNGDDNGEQPESKSPSVPTGERTDAGESGENGPNEKALASLSDLEGWRVDGSAARVHYRGATDRYAIEYYAPSDCTLYWKVPPGEAGETAVPVGRGTVPAPLRQRVREDLASAGIDPAIDDRSL